MNLGPYQTSENEKPLLSAHNLLTYGVASYTPDWFDIKLLGSYQKVDTDTDLDFDGSSNNVAYFKPTGQFARVVTSDLQFLSKKGGILPDWDTLTAGFYYFHEAAGFDPVEFGVVDPSQLGTGTTALQPLFNTIVSALDQNNLPLPSSGIDLLLRGDIQTKAFAGYFQNTVQPLEAFNLPIAGRTNWLDITIGGRYQYEIRQTTKASSSLKLSDGSASILDFPLASTTTVNFSPKLTIDFKPIENQLIYATVQQGQKSGTYNVVAIYTAPDYVQPEKITAFEIGNKGTVLDGSLRYSTAIFDNEIKDLQTQVVSLQSGGAVTFVNAPKTRIYGAEFDTTWQMFPSLLPGFVLTAGGAYLHGRFISFPNASGFDPTTGLFFGANSLTLQQGRDFSGNTTVRTPKLTISVGPSYSQTAPGGSIEIGGDVYYNSGYFFDTQNLASNPAYFLLNARASYLYDPWNLRITVYGANLTDSISYSAKFPTDFGTLSHFNPPREFGLRLSYQF